MKNDNNLEAEKPAQGILSQGDFGIAKYYFVQCDCGSPGCAHEIEVGADDIDVSVNISVTVRTKWWDKNRWKHIWHLITRGYSEMQTTIVLTEQTAINYAETIKSAIVDVKQFRNERVKTNAREADTNGSRRS